MTNSHRYQMQLSRWMMLMLGLMLCQQTMLGQGVGNKQKWLSVGSLQSWFSSVGCEVEEGRILEQQDGLQWPALYRYQDMEAAKGLWIGAANWTDETGVNYPHKVVHAGPRVSGLGSGPNGGFFPIKFELISKYAHPEVFVDGAATSSRTDEIDRVDPTIKADRMILNVVNTALGITMTRRILQFGQNFHDSYLVYEYEFENTGNTDYDDNIELPSQVVDSLYFFYQYRNAINREGCYVMGNSSRWGINTMNDTRGDGVTPPFTDTTGAGLRCQYSWHGKYPSWTRYDNLGAPIWDSPYFDKADTVGRLASSAFLGVVTIHADRSATDPTDDTNQPSTTTWKGSDDPLNFRNDQFSIAGMNAEFSWMSEGHNPNRHAALVEPAGNFTSPTGDPSMGTSGGISSANGYGPYRLAHGQKIKIVMAEAAGGLSRAKQVSVGRRFKAGTINAKAKNDSVFTGRDSLFATMRRAIASYRSEYNIPQAPLPPKSIDIVSGGDKIALTWTVYDENDPNLAGFRIYRSVGRYDALNDTLLYVAGRSERSFNDTSALRGYANFYYIVAFSNPTTGGPGTPAGAVLTSNRVMSQTYDPAFLKRQSGGPIVNGQASHVRIVPNPYIMDSSPLTRLGIGDVNTNKIAFYEIPGYCTIKIYTEIGELVRTIEHKDGSGDAYWDCITSSDQLVVSGVYIAVIEDTKTGGREIQKFVVIR